MTKTTSLVPSSLRVLALTLASTSAVAAPNPGESRGAVAPAAAPSELGLLSMTELGAPPKTDAAGLRRWLAAIAAQPPLLVSTPVGELVAVDAPTLPVTVYGGAVYTLNAEGLSREFHWDDEPTVRPAASVRAMMSPDPMLATMEIAPEVSVEVIGRALAELEAAGYTEVGLLVETTLSREPPPAPWQARADRVRKVLDATEDMGQKHRKFETALAPTLRRCEPIDRTYASMGRPEIPPSPRSKIILDGIGEAIDRCPLDATAHFATLISLLVPTRRSATLRVSLGATTAPLAAAPGTPWRAIAPRLVGRTEPLRFAVGGAP